MRRDHEWLLRHAELYWDLGPEWETNMWWNLLQWAWET